MGNRALTGLIFLIVLGCVSPLWAQSGASVQYVYDALGRLTTVVDSSGNVATYNYDAVGNLLSITRTTTSPSALAIFGFSPAQGSAGQTVVIQGQNFSTTPIANTVQFNGTAATVAAATANSLTVTVPTGATTGLISVTVGTSTANSSSNFTVLAIPVITSVSPTVTVQTPTISSFQVTGSNLAGATFSFAPAFVPPAILISNVVINGNGTSATMTLALASNAAGPFALVATNGSGSTPATPSSNNTLTILSSDPSADADGDGLTNIYEIAIGTNYANSSTPSDGLPDGWALFFTSPSTPPLSPSLANQTGANGLSYLLSFQRGLNPLSSILVAPTVASVFPANLTTNYPTNAVIVVRFSEPLLAGVSLQAAQTAINTALPAQSNFSTANAASAAQVLQAYLQRTCCGTTAVPGVVQVLQNGTTPIAGFVSLSNDQLSLTFAPAGPLSATTAYTISVQGVRDAAGNLMSGSFQSTFTTGTGPLKATTGTVLTNPVDTATGVDTNAPFRIMFSTPVNPSTLNSSTFFVLDNTTHVFVPGLLQVDAYGLTASFVPSQPYVAGRQFFAGIASGLQSFTGSSYNINASNGITFTTGYGTDNQSFHWVGTSPADGLTAVPLNALVVLEFDDPVDATTSLTGLQVQLAGIPVPGAIALSDGNKRITFTPASQWTANSTYQVVTTTQLTDFAGNQLANPDTSTFTTGSATDTTSPAVTTNLTPLGGATGVPTNAMVQVQFSKRIDPLTVTTSTFWVYPQGSGPNFLVPGAVSVSADGLTATFKPSAALTPATMYQFTLTNGVTDMENHTLSFAGSTFTTDVGPATTPPTVVLVSPPNLSTGVPVNVPVKVVMSVPLSYESFVEAPPTAPWITLTTGGTGVPGTVTLSPDRTTLTFVPSALLAVSTPYTVTVSGVTDQAGNTIAPPVTSGFTTGTSGVADTTPPVVSVTPLNGATGVAVNSPVVWTFNENIDPSTVNSTNFPVAMSGSCSPLLAGTYGVSGALVTFTPLGPMPSNTLICEHVNAGGVKDLAGNSPTSTFGSTFTTVTATSTTPPTVTFVTPGTGATGIGLNAQVTLRFSESLNASTVNANNFGLWANGKKLNASPAASADNHVVTLTPNGALPASSVVTVIATSGVSDLYGNALAYFTSPFTTAAPLDTTHPSVSVTSQRPYAGASSVPLNTTVVLYVNEAMNTTTIPGALHILQNRLTVNGTVQATDNGQTIQFTPSVPFLNNAQVQVFLDTTAQDVDGNNLGGVWQGSFTTVADTSTIAPAMVSTNPANQAPAVATNVVIYIGFNETLNSGTVNSTNVYLTQSTNNGPIIGSTPSLLAGGTVITLTPNTTLTANTPYFYHVTSGLQGTNGQPFSTNSWSFTTGAGTDLVAPTINTLSPPNGSSNVGNNPFVRVLFSKPINPLTVNANSIQLTSGGTAQVPDVINFSNNFMNVLLVPHGPLPDNTSMTLTISGVRDVAGNAVSAQTTNFTTGTGPDLIIPVVVSTNPFSGESGVPLNAPIQAQLNEPVDPGTVNGNSSALTVTDTTTSQQVTGSTGSPALSANGQTISFVPSASLTATHAYGVTFGNGVIADLAGNPLGGSPNFSFTAGTASDTTQPQVSGVSPANGLTGVPTNAQVMVQFNEPIDALTLNQITLTGGGTVAVTQTLSNANMTLILVPIAPLNPNTTYTVTVTGVQDISGNSQASAPPTTFTTGTGADLSSPTISSVTPSSGATGVLRNSTIQVHFSKRINPLTVSTSTFWVALSSTPLVPITGQPITVSTDGLTATFTPNPTLAASTSYTIQVTTGITDLDGQILSNGSNTSFATGTQ
jgi:YD repeat-containing protein